MNIPYIPSKEFGKGIDFSYGFSQPSVPIAPDPTKYVGSDVSFGNFNNVSFPISPDPDFLWQPEINQLQAMIDDTNFEQPNLSGSLALVGVDRPSVEFQEGFGELLVPFVSPLLYGVNKVFGASRYTGSNRRKRKLELLSAVDDPIRPPVEEEGGFKSFMPQNNQQQRIGELVRAARATGLDPAKVRSKKPYTASQIRAARARMRANTAQRTGKRLMSRGIPPVPSYDRKNRGHYTNANGTSGGYILRTNKDTYYPRGSQGRGGRAIQRWGNSQTMEGRAVSGSDINATAMKGESYRQVAAPHGQNKLTAKVYLGTMAYGNAATGGNGTVNWLPNAGQIGGQYYFSPTSAIYVDGNNIVARTGNNYDEYRVLGGKFTFIPCISGFSNPDIRVAALVTKNIDHFARCSNGSFVGSPSPSTGISTPTRVSLMTNPDACAVPGWITQFSCPIPASKWLRTFSPDSSTGSAFTFTDSMASQRQSFAFVLGVSITGAVPATTDLPVMEVWMDINIHFRSQAYFINKASTLSADRKYLSTLTVDEVKLFRDSFPTAKAQISVLDRLAEDLKDTKGLAQSTQDLLTEYRNTRAREVEESDVKISIDKKNLADLQARKRIRARNHPDDIDIERFRLKNRDLADVYWDEGSDDFEKLKINNLADLDDNKSDIVKKKSSSLKSNSSKV